MTEHYFTENPASEIKEKKFIQTIKGSILSFISVSGVFAFEDKVDKVSELLIRNFTPSGIAVLDIGCGYGAIGLFIKSQYNTQNVWMTDINSRAIEYANLNALRNKLEVTVLKSDLFSELTAKSFDDILSNPPFAAGKKLNTRLIEESWDHLNPGGSLWLVAHHNKGGSTLKEIMRTRFNNAVDIEKSGGIRVYRSVKKI
jgi:16S rRNA (guanine1207-N2)-methyltransferase